MRVVLDVQVDSFDERGMALIFRTYLHAAALHNAALFKTGRYPGLYQSGVVFRNEPWMGRFEEIASIPLVLSRGWGDCDDLCSYRIGELLAQGKHATAKVYWRRHGTEVRLYHAEVRMQDGTVEDPSRFLGM